MMFLRCCLSKRFKLGDVKRFKNFITELNAVREAPGLEVFGGVHLYLVFPFLAHHLHLLRVSTETFHLETKAGFEHFIFYPQQTEEVIQIGKFLRIRWIELDFRPFTTTFAVFFKKLELRRKGLQKTLQDRMKRNT